MLPYRQGVGLENASFHCRHSTKRISAVLSSTSRSKLRKPTHRRFYNFSIRQNTKRMLSLVFTPSDSLCQVFKHQKIALPPELIRLFALSAYPPIHLKVIPSQQSIGWTVGALHLKFRALHLMNLTNPP